MQYPHHHVETIQRTSVCVLIAITIARLPAATKLVVQGFSLAEIAEMPQP